MGIPGAQRLQQKLCRVEAVAFPSNPVNFSLK